VSNDKQNEKQAVSYPSTIVLEIASKNNANYVWNPTQDTLRGRYCLHNLKGQSSIIGLFNFPDTIPGIRVVIKPREKLAKIYDPLEQNKELLNEINKVNKSIFHSEVTHYPEKKYELRDNDHVATWLYWAFRAVDSGHAIVLEGELPNLKQIASIGVPQREFYDTVAKRKTPEPLAV